MQEIFEKIIEKLEENQTIVFHLGGGKPTQSIDLSRAIEIVKQAAAEYNNGWIPVSERFPKEFDTVLVTMADDCKGFSHMQGCLDIGYLDNRIGFAGACDTYSIDDIIAWQPLPQPYQPKGE